MSIALPRKQEIIKDYARKHPGESLNYVTSLARGLDGREILKGRGNSKRSGVFDN